jgi:hypothetical protein
MLEKRIDIIPCRLQAPSKSHGWFDLFFSDRLYVDFSSPDEFDNSFKKLIDEIEYIKTRSQTYPSKSYFPTF